MDSPPILFDHAAGGVMRLELVRRIPELLQRYPYNPHGLTCYAEFCRRALLDAEKRLLASLGADDSFTVIWCASGTECANIAMRGLAHIAHIACAETTHPALYKTALAVKDVTPDFIQRRMKAFSLVNNETGAITLPHRDNPQDILLMDCCQAVGHIPMPPCTNYDMAIISGRKIGGPSSAAALVLRRTLLKEMSQVVTGGGQQLGVRSGTVDVVLAILLADAVQMAVAEQSANFATVRMLNDHLRASLPPQWPLFSPTDASPFILAFAVPQCEGALLTRILAENYHILIGAGSACSAESHQSSPTLKALGVPDALARSMLRISFAPDNTEKQIDLMVEALKDAIQNY